MATKKYLDYEGLALFLQKIEERYAPIQALVFKGTAATISALPTVSGTQPGWMYTVTTGGTTTADFVEGAGKALQDGENVVAVNVAAAGDPAVMKWDIMGGVFDISDRLQFGDSLPASPVDGQTFLFMGDTTYTYTAVTPAGTENPAEEGWYESDGGSGYQLTEDTEVDSGKTYYTRAEQYVKGVIYVYNSSGSEWVPQSSGDAMIPITSSEIDDMFDAL